MSEELKVKNYFTYCWRIFAKLFSFLIFGVCTSVVLVTVFPFLKIFSRSELIFQHRARKLLRNGICVLFAVMKVIGVLRIKISSEDKKKLKELKSAIVVANHPAFLDSVMLLSFLSCSDFVAKNALSKKNIISPIINSVFMTNTMDFDKMLERSRENFLAGGTLALFPEGTRSLPSGLNRFKKGAARISLATGCPVIPVILGGNSKIGMRKGDRVFQAHPSEPYIYEISIKETVYPEEFAGLPDAIAAKRMTAKLRTIFTESLE